MSAQLSKDGVGFRSFPGLGLVCAGTIPGRLSPNCCQISVYEVIRAHSGQTFARLQLQNRMEP